MNDAPGRHQLWAAAAADTHLCTLACCSGPNEHVPLYNAPEPRLRPLVPLHLLGLAAHQVGWQGTVTKVRAQGDDWARKHGLQHQKWMLMHAFKVRSATGCGLGSIGSSCSHRDGLPSIDCQAARVAIAQLIGRCNCNFEGQLGSQERFLSCAAGEQSQQQHSHPSTCESHSRWPSLRDPGELPATMPSMMA